MRCCKHTAANDLSIRKAVKRFRPIVEKLEERCLLTANMDFDSADSTPWASYQVCNCPICNGQGLESIPVLSAAQEAPSLQSPLASLPVLNSLPRARAQLFLDFDGSTTGSWGSYSNVVTPAFDTDGNRNTFSTSELAAINQIWTRVAEDFAPFNINVTTVDPGNLTDKVTARIAIGGNHSDWYRSPAGGVAYLGGFYNGAPNVGFVFPAALGNGNPKFVAEAASHEAGHLFGLNHQAEYNGTTKVNDYSQGANGWAPVMGVGYYQDVSTWHNGSTPAGVNTRQDDMSILAGTSNGFGYRADDYGNSTSAAFSLNTIQTGNSFSLQGVVEQNNDIDAFSFATTGGAVNLRVTGIGVGQNLDSTLELRSATGSLIVAAQTSSLNEAISRTLAAGTYYVYVKSSDAYGRVGQYTLSGSFTPSQIAAPKIAVSVDGRTISSGGAAIDFGSVRPNTAVDKTFTIRNTGNANLTLSPIGALPAGFTVKTNLSRTTLNPGASATFTLTFRGTTPRTYSGSFSLQSNDSSATRFAISLSGTAATAETNTPSSIQVIDNGGSGFTTRGNWTTERNKGRGSSVLTSAVGSGQNTATYTFNNLTPGRYRVSTTWVAGRTLATNTPFTILSGSRSLATVSVNQELDPRSFTENNVRWSRLADVTITGNNLTVTLSNRANDRVMADAIRIERIASAELPGGINQPEVDFIEVNSEHEAASVDFAFQGLNPSFTSLRSTEPTSFGRLSIGLDSVADSLRSIQSPSQQDDHAIEFRSLTLSGGEDEELELAHHQAIESLTEEEDQVLSEILDLITMARRAHAADMIAV